MLQGNCRHNINFGFCFIKNLSFFRTQDSLRKKQQPPVGSTPISVPSPQPSPTFSPAITIPSAAQPTVQSLQQQHNEIKEVSFGKVNEKK